MGVPNRESPFRLFPRLGSEKVARLGGQSSSYSSSYSVVLTADDEYEYDDEDDSGFGQIRRGGSFTA